MPRPNQNAAADDGGPGGAGLKAVTGVISPADRWDHFLARCGVNRSGHRVEPGVYAIGQPSPESPVFVTANYTLSFDALRSALDGIDGYILLLDTEGINVWCAAGKGTFGTAELVNRIEATGLGEAVRHRTLILPQLGAPGVAAHEVQRRTGFEVEYGPVRATDLPAYLKTREATPEMRRVTFGLLDRIVLIPVELRHVFWPALIATVVLYLAAGALFSMGVLSAVVAGVVLFPALLPWIPTREFTTKGAILGVLAAIPFARAVAAAHQDGPGWAVVGWTASLLLIAIPVTAFLALNFTGSTPFTSRSGVRREIQRYTRAIAGMFAGGIITMVGLIAAKLAGIG